MTESDMQKLKRGMLVTTINKHSFFNPGEVVKLCVMHAQKTIQYRDYFTGEITYKYEIELMKISGGIYDWTTYFMHKENCEYFEIWKPLK